MPTKNTEKPSLVITAKMNPELSDLERQAWDIWQSIDRREVIRRGFTSKAELLATALIQYEAQVIPDSTSEVENLLRQILKKLNEGFYMTQPLEQSESDVLMDFAQNRQMLNDMIEGE